MHGLVVDISDLAGRPGAARSIGEEASLSDLETPLARVEAHTPLRIEVSAETVIEGIAVSGQVSGERTISCSRCLIEYKEKFQQSVDEIFYYDRHTAERNDGYLVQESRIDLEPMVRDAVVLGLPVHPLHDPECAGLCAQCGADLNHADCGHRQVPGDLRWAPLQSLLAAGSKRAG